MPLEALLVEHVVGEIDHLGQRLDVLEGRVDGDRVGERPLVLGLCRSRLPRVQRVDALLGEALAQALAQELRVLRDAHAHVHQPLEARPHEGHGGADHGAVPELAQPLGGVVRRLALLGELVDCENAVEELLVGTRLLLDLVEEVALDQLVDGLLIGTRLACHLVHLAAKRSTSAPMPLSFSSIR